MPPLNCLCMLLLCKLVMGAPGKYCPGKEGREEAVGEGEERDVAESWSQLAEPTPGATKIQLQKPSPKLWALALATSSWRSCRGGRCQCSLTALRLAMPGFAPGVYHPDGFLGDLR